MTQTTAEILQSTIMTAIVEASLVERDGIKTARLDVGATLDAFSIITASLLASAPEAQTPAGVKRVLRRQARQLERRTAEFRRHTAEHGSPFVMAPAP